MSKPMRDQAEGWQELGWMGQPVEGGIATVRRLWMGCEKQWARSPSSGRHTSITWGLQGQGMEEVQT